NQPSKKIIDFVRGLSPYPAAWTKINDKVYKVFKCSHSDHSGQSAVESELWTDNKTFLNIKTADGWVSIEEFQPEGKKRMSVSEFFRGNKL
ncbi:MAG TPA: methionyl-tRNA formyltransferase, partial [Cyclobacteriaceae bacterium]|nr:methionyl-tRNA formyltransferase [Cyclobacteriaceae bacterium]